MSLSKTIGVCFTALLVVASGCGKSSMKATSTAGGTSVSQSVGSASSGVGPAIDGAKSGLLSKSALIEKADQVCRTVNEQRATIKLISTRSYIELVPSLITAERMAVRDLQRLVPPPTMASDWKHIVAGEQSIATVTAKFVHAIATRNSAALHALGVQSREIQSRIAAVSTRDGFRYCGQI